MHIDSPEITAAEHQEPLLVSEGGRIPELEEMKARQRETEDLVQSQRAEIDVQSAELIKLRDSREKYVKGYREARDRIVQLEGDVKEVTRIHKESWKEWEQHARALEAELTQTKALLAVRTAELSGAQSFLSMMDRISEAEVLGIVRDLNENIFQVAANLTEEWEKFRVSQASSRPRLTITDRDIESLSKSFGATLAHKVRNRRSAAVTILIQSYFCNTVTQLTSSWKHNKELGALRSVYQDLSAAEGQAISARWRSLTHSYLPEPSSHSLPIAQHVGDLLWITGLFPTQQHSFDFVKANVYSGIEKIDRLATRLESVFMVDVTSSDMCLFFGTPSTPFDATRMSEECESDKNSASVGQDKVAGTTEVGVEKRVGRRGDREHTEVLLKTTVVLEKDLVDL